MRPEYQAVSELRLDAYRSDARERARTRYPHHQPRVTFASWYCRFVEHFRSRTEGALASTKAFRSLLNSIAEMTPVEKKQLLATLDSIETTVASQPQMQEKAQNSVWHGVLGFLLMGLDPSIQALIHQSTGPESKRAVILARIENIKRALSEQ